MTKKILVIDGNPSPFSFTACLADEYVINAEKSGFDVKSIDIRDLQFDPNLKFGYSRQQKLEPDLEKAQDLLKWCEHLVLVTPVWWFSFPALLKGFFDRVFLPNFAFRVERGGDSRKLVRMLSGRTATIIYTFGGPKYDLNESFVDPIKTQTKNGILNFVGFKNINTYCLYNTLGITNMGRRVKFINKVINLGKNGK